MYFQVLLTVIPKSIHVKFSILVPDCCSWSFSGKDSKQNPRQKDYDKNITIMHVADMVPPFQRFFSFFFSIYVYIYLYIEEFREIILEVGGTTFTEYGCMLKITEKSDVYSYGVVLLEMITGKKPVDPSFGDGDGDEQQQQHVIEWVREQLKSKRDPVQILDPKLQEEHHPVPDTQIQEMLQALGISLLCTSTRPEDRPTMKDVAVLLREIRHDPTTAPSGGTTTTTTDHPHKPNGSKNPQATSYSSSHLFLLQPSSHSSLALTYSSSSSAPYNATTN